MCSFFLSWSYKCVTDGLVSQFRRLNWSVLRSVGFFGTKWVYEGVIDFIYTYINILKFKCSLNWVKTNRETETPCQQIQCRIMEMSNRRILSRIKLVSLTTSIVSPRYCVGHWKSYYKRFHSDPLKCMAGFNVQCKKYWFLEILS